MTRRLVAARAFPHRLMPLFPSLLALSTAGRLICSLRLRSLMLNRSPCCFRSSFCARPVPHGSGDALVASVLRLLAVRLDPGPWPPHRLLRPDPGPLGPALLTPCEASLAGGVIRVTPLPPVCSRAKALRRRRSFAVKLLEGVA
jgi:hypothetical protein